MPSESISKVESKICKNCLTDKPIKSFNKNYPKTKNGNITYANTCNTCRTILWRVRNFQVETFQKPSPYLFCEETTRQLKVCSCCEQVLIFDKFARIHSGVSSECLVCRRGKRQSRYYSLTVEERKILGKEKREKFPITPELNKKYYDNKSGEQKRKKLEANKIRLKENPNLAKKYRESAKQNREFKLKQMSGSEREIFLQKELESRRKRRHIRRAREQSSGFIIPFTKAEIIKRDGLKCYLCDKLLTEKTATLEHILPLARGGHHKPENVKIACRLCNLSKHTKTLSEFKKHRGDYLKYQRKI